MSEIKNFLFDLYGTLVDIRTNEQSGAFWKKIAAMLGSASAADVKRRYAELCAEQSLAEGGEFDLLTVMRKLTDEYGYEYGAMRFAEKFREASIKRLRLFAGAVALLDGLKERGACVYLLSNAQSCFTRGELKVLGLTDKFDGILLSSEAGWKKPSEKFFQAAFERFGILPNECIYTGNDLRDDVEGARRAGIRSVYIRTAQSGTYPEVIRTDLTARSFNELARLLFGLAEGKSL